MREFILFSLLIAVIRTKVAADDWRSRCKNLPRQDFFNAQQVDLLCSHYEHFQMDVRNKASEDYIKHPTMNQIEYLNEIEKCSRTNCLQEEARRQKRQTEKNIRKEIRMMSYAEREDLWTAMNALKGRMVDNITAWDLHTLVHYPDSAPGAHWGPAFLPWHREFLRQFEIALQKEVPGVTLPFWDSTLDQGLPDPADSVLWTEELMGNGNGYVKTGPFKDWETNVLMPLSQIPVKRLYRMTGGRPQDRLLSPKDVDWIVNRPKFQDLTFCHDSTFETLHGLSHVWVGGFMFVIRVSPNDPSFYMHHAFVDNLWEQFRQNRQNRWQRENEWSEKTCNKLHEKYGQMKPFAIMNKDGLSNNYTDQWYEYENVRHCTQDDDSCDSQYYWCDSSAWRCRSKVVFGGNCTGFEGTSICFNSICIDNKCQLPPQIMHNRKHFIEREANLRTFDRVWTKTLLLDADAHGISQDIASVTVIDHANGDNTTVYLKENLQFPELPGLIYLPLPKPQHDTVLNVSLLAKDGYGRYCQAQCYNATAERYQVCQPHLSISGDSERSSPISYTHSMITRNYLDVDLSLHPRSITPSLPYIVFSCSRKLMTSAMIESLPSQVRAPQSHDPLVWLRVIVHRKEEQNLQIEVESFDVDEEVWSSSIKRAASPFDPSIVLVQAPNPALHAEGVRVKVSVLEDGSRINCLSKCTLEDGSQTRCDGTIELHNDSARSDETVFTADQAALPVLGWNMRGHPSTWRHKVPYLTLYCDSISLTA